MQTTASPKLPRRYVRLAAVRGGGGLTSTPPRPPPTNPTTNNSGPKKYLFEPRHGLPVVRETLDLGGLLRAIRSESVSRIYWFTQRGVDLLEGPCLIVYKDGTVKKSYVPPHSGRYVERDADLLYTNTHTNKHSPGDPFLLPYPST